MSSSPLPPKNKIKIKNNHIPEPVLGPIDMNAKHKQKRPAESSGSVSSPKRFRENPTPVRAPLPKGKSKMQPLDDTGAKQKKSQHPAKGSKTLPVQKSPQKFPSQNQKSRPYIVSEESGEDNEDGDDDDEDEEDSEDGKNVHEVVSEISEESDDSIEDSEELQEQISNLKSHGIHNGSNVATSRKPKASQIVLRTADLEAFLKEKIKLQALAPPKKKGWVDECMRRLSAD